MMQRVAKTLLYLLCVPALVPLLYAPGLLYPYVAPKTLLFRALGVLVAAAFAFLMFSGRSFYWSRLREKSTWIPGALLCVAYVTSLFGVDFYHSFWSVFDRGDGLLTLTAAVIFFYGTLLTADESFLRRLYAFVVWGASLVALYALLQWLQSVSGLDLPLIEIPRGRFGSTFGNAAYLASYLGMTLFLAIGLAREYSGRWQRAAYASAALQFLAILIAATRGTLLALALVAFIVLTYTALKGSGKLRSYARAGLALGVIAAGLFFSFRAQLANVPIESVRRVASISLKDPTVESRFFIWKNMLSASMGRPLTGYGAEHVDVVFNRFYDPTALVEEWFDRSHNSFIDYLVQYGVFGFALYVALILSFAYAAYRKFKGGEEWGAFFFLIALTYAVQNFFVFDTVMTFWLLLVLFAGLFVESTAKSTVLSYIPQMPRAVPAGALIALLFVLIPVAIQPLRANLALAQGYLYHIVDARRAAESMQKGLAIGTYADLEYGYQAYQMYTDRQMGMLSGGERIIAYRYALETLTTNLEKYPYDARTAVYLAHVLDVAPPEMPADEARVRDVIAQAIELSPKRMQPHYLLVNIQIRKGDALPPGEEKNARYLEGITPLEEYARLVPKLAEPRFVLASLYLTMGDTAHAKKWADEAFPLYTPDKAVARRASRYYLLTEDWPNAVYFLKEVIRTTPDDYRSQYDLAKAEFLSGNIEEAKRIVERLRIEAPGLVETDPVFLSSLNAGT